jgi:hypothetical protein
MEAAVISYEDTIQVLADLLAAHKSGDAEALVASTSAAQSILDGYQSSPEEEIARFAMMDSTIVLEQDALAVAEEYRGIGEFVVQKTATGLMIDGYAPGLEKGAAHGIGLEFDRGSMKVLLFRSGYDDVQADIHIDGNGAHVSDGLANGTSYQFCGEDGVCGVGSDWVPAAPAAPTSKL